MGFVLAIIAGVAVLNVGLALFTALTARQAEAAAPPRGRFIEVGNARLHYLDRGSGPVVVMVHGLGGNLRNFYELIDRVALTCRVVAVDRPGSGYSRMISGAHPSLAAQATIIAEFIHKLDLDRPLLVGHSLGGALALALALEHRNCVRSLVLISALSQVEPVPPAIFKSLAIRSSTLRWLVAWTLMVPLGRVAHQATLKALFAPELIPEGFDVNSSTVLGLRPMSFIAASKDMVTVSDELALMTRRYPSLTIPVDVIFGRQDPILDHQVHGGGLIAVLPNATWHLIEGGHMIPVTMADKITSVIEHAAARV
jgi:pimeloyl-ACP methyl ester carboxylesterase